MAKRTFPVQRQDGPAVPGSTLLHRGLGLVAVGLVLAFLAFVRVALAVLRITGLVILAGGLLLLLLIVHLIGRAGERPVR